MVPKTVRTSLLCLELKVHRRCENSSNFVSILNYVNTVHILCRSILILSRDK
jgi:hypothetical protein